MTTVQINQKIKMLKGERASCRVICDKSTNPQRIAKAEYRLKHIANDIKELELTLALREAEVGA